ncbi:MAG TPA: IS4 family transposase [Flavisolibacter sp.]
MDILIKIGATSTEQTQNALLSEIIEKLNITIEDETFISQHKDSSTSFTRDRVFTFKVLLSFLMTNLQKGLQREIALFVEAIESEGGSIPEVSKAAFCKARKKLKPSAFSELSKVTCKTFYGSNDVQLWNGYRLLGVDGSTVELPNSKEIQDKFGVFKYRQDGKAVCMGRTLMMYDTLNHMTLDGSLDTIEESETSMLWKALPDAELKENDLLIFDRYYASHLLFFYLQKRGVQFCFRMKKNWWKVVETFYNSGKESTVVNLQLPAKDKAEAERLGITKKKLKVRLVRIELESGETEILLTSLINEEIFTPSHLKEVYGFRWPIEESYKTFKHKVCIENFSGKSYKAVLQDFYVKIFIMNLTAAAVRPINEALKKQSVKVRYVHQVNIIEAIATMKKAVVSFFVTGKIAQAIKRVVKRLSDITEPIRPGRKFKRNHQPKRKHHMNYKPV